MLTVKQAAEKIGISTNLVYGWCEAQLLPHYRIGRQGSRGAIRIAESDLEAFIAARKQGERRTPPPSCKRKPVNLENLKLS
jgi:excisionase family DNA binding protein